MTVCNSCHRTISKQTSTSGYIYKDGRAICSICRVTAIENGIRANRSRRRVLDFLDRQGFQNIPKNVEIVLSSKTGLSSHSRHVGTQGLTLTQSHFKAHQRTGMTHQIGILYGLPQIEFEGILAHELLHVWQNEHDIKLSPMHTEGLCNLASYAIYLSQPSALSTHLITQLLKNPDPIYGNGFRLMKKKWEDAGGFPQLILEISKNKNGFEQSLWKKIFG